MSRVRCTRRGRVKDSERLEQHGSESRKREGSSSSSAAAAAAQQQRRSSAAAEQSRAATRSSSTEQQSSRACPSRAAHQRPRPGYRACDGRRGRYRAAAAGSPVRGHAEAVHLRQFSELCTPAALRTQPAGELKSSCSRRAERSQRGVCESTLSAHGSGSESTAGRCPSQSPPPQPRTMAG